MSLNTSFPQLLHAYFNDWLAGQRNISRHTVLSYRDTWRLFLPFVARRQNRTVTNLTLSQLNASEILAFLQYIEQERRVTIATRNCRLAALRSFFSYVAEREPLMIEHCAAVLRIPSKRGVKRTISYLEAEEVAAILAQPNRQTLEGQRDHALLSLLYNTGARIQEALNLCPRDIRLEAPPQVRLQGKGKKERICPIWAETADLLASLLQRNPRKSDEPIFVNRYGESLGASGVRFKLRQYWRSASTMVPSLSTKRITPHVFRHTTAVHLVAAGVDVTVIRSWMGHANLNTTNHYAQANLETKRKALEQLDRQATTTPPSNWRPTDDLLAWLESL
jgi:Site-specific recombinase XerD